MRFTRRSSALMALAGVLTASLKRIFSEDHLNTPADDSNSEADEESSDFDANDISILEANQFHIRLIDMIHDRFDLFPLQQKLHVEYGGVLRWPARSGLWEEGSVMQPLGWTVVGAPLVVFKMQLSTAEKRVGSVAAVGQRKFGCRVLYMHVTFVNGAAEVTPEAIDAKQADLGGKSVREFVKMLEESPGAPDVP